jgi:hypothetical protein
VGSAPGRPPPAGRSCLPGATRQTRQQRGSSQIPCRAGHARMAGTTVAPRPHRAARGWSSADRSRGSPGTASQQRAAGDCITAEGRRGLLSAGEACPARRRRPSPAQADANAGSSPFVTEWGGTAGSPSSAGPDLDSADRALPAPQHQELPVQQIAGLRNGVLGGHLDVVQVGTALGDCPPGR